MLFDVDVLVCSPTTIRVDVESIADASEAALAGRGEDVSGVSYTYGEVVEIRRTPKFRCSKCGDTHSPDHPTGDQFFCCGMKMEDLRGLVR